MTAAILEHGCHCPRGNICFVSVTKQLLNVKLFKEEKPRGTWRI